MRFSYTVYKHSPLATFCSAFGWVFLITGLYSLVSVEFIAAIIFFALGGLLLFLAPRVNKRTVERKMEKALKDPKLIRNIQESAEAAYALFLNMPTIPMLQYVEQYNPEAARWIAAKQAGHITEDELIQKLRGVDETFSKQRSDQVASSDRIYKNEMFELKRAYTQGERTKKTQEELIRKKKQSKNGILICGAVFFVAILAMVFFSMFPVTVATPREVEDSRISRAGAYVQMDVTEIREYKTEDGCAFYIATDGVFTRKVRISQDEVEKLHTFFYIDSDTKWKVKGEAVSIYGELRSVDGEFVLDGSLKREQKQTESAVPVIIVAGIVLSISGICLAVFAEKYLAYRKESKVISRII